MPPQRRGAFYGRDIAVNPKTLSQAHTEGARCMVRHTPGARVLTRRGVTMARARRGGILSVRAGVQACVCVCVLAQVWARVRAGVCVGVRAGAPERIKN